MIQSGSATVFGTQGSGSSDATTLRFYRSTDGTITTADTELDTASVSGLTTGASSSHQFETTLPRGDGTYYYGTCVDAVTDESDTTNNCSSSWSFTRIKRRVRRLNPNPPKGLALTFKG